MRIARPIAAVAVAAAMSITSLPSASAWYYNPGYMIPDEDVLWSPPKPAPKPVVEPVKPAPAPAPKPAPRPAILDWMPPVPAPKPVVTYTPPYVPSYVPAYVPPAPTISRRVPDYDPVSDAIMIGSSRVSVPAPAPAPVVAPAPRPTVPSPANPVTVAPDRVVTTTTTRETQNGTVTELTTTVTKYTVQSDAPPKDKPLKTDGSNSIKLETVNFIENKNVYVKPDKAEDALVKSIREAAAKGMTLIRIEGHTDPQGSFAAGVTLSEKRADAVKDSLESMLEERGFRCGGGNGRTDSRVCTDKNGGPSITLEPVAFSEKYLVSPTPAGCNANHDNRAKCEKAFAPNRRAEIKASVPVISETKVETVVSTTTKEPVRESTCETRGDCPPPSTCETRGDCPPPSTCATRGDCPPPSTCATRGDCPPPAKKPDVVVNPDIAVDPEPRVFRPRLIEPAREVVSLTQDLCTLGLISCGEEPGLVLTNPGPTPKPTTVVRPS